jgi:hypothetical protein
MRIGLTILISFSLASAFGQYPKEKYAVDTIHLNSFEEKKVVAYEINSVTVCIKYDDYRQALYKTLQSFSKDIKSETSKYIINTHKFLDSIYKKNEIDILEYDTIHISQKTFDKLVLRSVIDFDKQIENSTCAIFNEKNIRQYFVVRQTGSWYKEFDLGWGGRKYFLLNQKTPFYLVADWTT